MIGNIFIKPDDYIFADRDAVLVIPGKLAHIIADMAHVRKDKEDKIRQIITETNASAKAIEQEIGRW